MHKATTFFYVCAGLLSLALLLPRNAAAAWPTSPLVNVPLCTAVGLQWGPLAVSDASGGVIVVWQDYRSGAEGDIYAQHVLASGLVDPAWPTDGRALCAAVGEQRVPMIVSDGTGGAIITWQDSSGTSWDIYAQRVQASGVVDPAWPADGRALCTVVGDQSNPTIASDGLGGAIVTWQDDRGGTYPDIYAQHVLANGAVDPAWPTHGRALCTAAYHQFWPTIISDGSGGALVTWADYRSGTSFDIYAQRVLASGVVDPAWPADGRALCTAVDNQYLPTIISDGSGGALVTWVDYRSGMSSDIYAQRVLASGVVDPAWPADGRALCTAAYHQVSPTIISDGSGGALVTWVDYRSGTNYDIYAQRVLASGVVDPAWPTDGRALCTAVGEQSDPTIASDGLGGAIITWQDDRGGTDYDIYAQRVLASGVVDPAWPADGRALCIAESGQFFATISSDGSGGAIVAWQDYRSGTDTDIYAQRVQANGQLGGTVDVSGEPALALALDPVGPNPTRGGALRVHFTLASGTAASLELLDVAGRRIVRREVGSLGAGRHTLDLGEGQHLAPGLYLVCLRQGSNTRVTRVAMLD